MRPESDPLRVLSLGAGVQSSRLAIGFAEGELTPMPHCAIFADTGAEPKAVLDWLDILETMLPFPVHRVMEGDGLERSIELSTQGGRFAGAPFFAVGSDGRAAPLRRQCTREFKIQPIERKVRQLVGLEKGERGPKYVAVIQYIGISLDEMKRMKPSQTKWIRHEWPLVKLRQTRQHCIEFLTARNLKVPRSACRWCPYHDNAYWRNQRDNEPEEFAKSVAMDRLIRNGVKGSQDQLFVHRSMKPLDFALAANTDPSTSHASARALVHSGEHKRQCEVVLAAIRKYPNRTSREVAELAGLDRTMVGRRAFDLKDAGLIRETGVRKQANGRPGVTLEAV